MTDLTTAEWIATLSTEDVMTMLSAAIRDRDWLAVDGAMKILAIKDSVKAETVYRTLLAVTAAPREASAHVPWTPRYDGCNGYCGTCEAAVRDEGGSP